VEGAVDTDSSAVHTKREVLAQAAVCLGCCCGREDRGKPEVPVDFLKSEWKRLRLNTDVQLTISGCLGPCDCTNVVAILDSSGSRWFGNISGRLVYQKLVDWARAVKEAGKVLPLDAELERHHFNRWGESR
jgi:cobaltochelatase CobN